jgi:hypothetical protein
LCNDWSWFNSLVVKLFWNVDFFQMRIALWTLVIEFIDFCAFRLCFLGFICFLIWNWLRVCAFNSVFTLLRFTFDLIKTLLLQNFPVFFIFNLLHELVVCIFKSYINWFVWILLQFFRLIVLSDNQSILSLLLRRDVDFNFRQNLQIIFKESIWMI